MPSDTHRAYSLLVLKALDEETRTITGMATTPTPDRVGDVMDPKGASFQLPIPLLWQHNAREPIGEVFAAKVTPQGIEIQARLAKVDEPGKLKDRLDEAWQSIKAKLVRGLSIGFKELQADRIGDTYAYHYAKWMWLELSAVTIPANAEANIQTIKSIDRETDPQAATGRHLPGDAGAVPIVRALKGAPAMSTTIKEQIGAFEATRAAHVAKMNDMTLKSDGSTFDQAQTDEYTTLEREVESIDAHLPRLRKLEQTNIVSATPVTGATTVEKAADLRGGTTPIITVKSQLPKGTAFTRMCMAMAASKGDSFKAMERAKSWRETPEVELMVKAAVAAGSTTDATWAGPLVAVQPLVNEFLELLRPRTLLGRIPGLRQVPFNVSVGSQTTGGTYGWVGQGLAKPVTKADYATVTLAFAKAAGIIVLTEELVKLSTPSAEGLVREEMIAGMNQFLDVQFNDPAVAAVANVNPASITNGASTAAASGVTGALARADLAASVAVFTAAGIPLEGAVWLMNDSNAFGLSMSLNALGNPLFPGMSIAGGTIFGIPVVVSNNVSTRVILVHAPSILYADDGGVSIDVSREASIQMDSAPSNPSDATTVLVSLWQRNLVGLKAERFITWVRARTSAVRYITAAAYNGT